MTQNQLLADTALRIGQGFIGIAYEPKHQNDGMLVQAFQAWMDEDQTGNGWMKGMPWCATFASWNLWLAGLVIGVAPQLPKTASSSDFYAFAKTNLLLLDQPVVGCLALERGDGGSPGKTHHHTCMVVNVDPMAQGTFQSLDGNFGDKVGLNIHNIVDYDFVATC